MRLISDMKAKSILNYNARYRGLIVIGKSDPPAPHDSFGNGLSFLWLKDSPTPKNGKSHL